MLDLTSQEFTCYPHFTDEEHETELPSCSQVISGRPQIRTQTLQLQRLQSEPLHCSIDPDNKELPEL